MDINKFESNSEVFIKDTKSVEDFIQKGLPEEGSCTFQDIDFSGLNVNWHSLNMKNVTFLGCNLNAKEKLLLTQLGAQVYSAPSDLPYNPFRTQLYTCRELLKGFTTEKDESYDLKIYEHFSKCRFNPPIQEALWQRIHDHSIDQALRDILKFDAVNKTQHRCVGFMGGHNTMRTDPYFKKMALTAKLLTEAGYFVVSGGGPGIMEASNLGAHFAGKSNNDLEKAIDILSEAPHYTDANFHKKALEVIHLYPDGAESLAIPTWFYGHEPSNLFSSHIAKYFSNSIREDTLLAVSVYGVIFAPGSAGTTQEIFQDATQNHYGTYNYYSPMVFLGRERYEINTLIYPLLRQLAWSKKYYDMLHLTDDPEDILQFIQEHPPVKSA